MNGLGEKPGFDSEYIGFPNFRNGVVGQSWDSTCGYLQVKGLNVTETTGFSFSFWTYGHYPDNDWEIIYLTKTVVMHSGCISLWDETNHKFITNWFEGTGGKITEEYSWDCLIAPARQGYTFITINFAPDGTLTYYVNGALVIEKYADGRGNDYRTTIKDVYKRLIVDARQELKIGVGNLGFVDTVILSESLTQNEIFALHKDQLALK